LKGGTAKEEGGGGLASGGRAAMAVEAQDRDGGAGSAGGQRRPGWAAWAEEAKQAGSAKIEKNFFSE
jgi:hypothetical protein